MNEHLILGTYDCMLEEDEQNCPLCQSQQFPCVISEQCIPIEKRCNGVTDCIDGTDERNCTGMIRISFLILYIFVECPNGGFLCHKSGECIPDNERCDGETNCISGEDEYNCRTHLVEKTYLCHDQQHRIGMTRVCDGVEQCPDGSDERYCQPTVDRQSSSAENEDEIESTSSIDRLIVPVREDLIDGDNFEIVDQTIAPISMTTTKNMMMIRPSVTNAEQIPIGARVFEVTSKPAIILTTTSVSPKRPQLLFSPATERRPRTTTTMTTTTTTPTFSRFTYRIRPSTPVTSPSTTTVPSAFPHPPYIDIDQQLFIPMIQRSSTMNPTSIGLFPTSTLANRRTTTTTPTTILPSSTTRAHRISTTTTEQTTTDDDSPPSTPVVFEYRPPPPPSYRRGPFHRFYMQQQQEQQQRQQEQQRYEEQERRYEEQLKQVQLYEVQKQQQQQEQHEQRRRYEQQLRHVEQQPPRVLHERRYQQQLERRKQLIQQQQQHRLSTIETNNHRLDETNRQEYEEDEQQHDAVDDINRNRNDDDIDDESNREQYFAY